MDRFLGFCLPASGLTLLLHLLPHLHLIIAPPYLLARPSSFLVPQSCPRSIRLHRCPCQSPCSRSRLVILHLLIYLLIRPSARPKLSSLVSRLSHRPAFSTHSLDPTRTIPVPRLPRFSYPSLLACSLARLRVCCPRASHIVLSSLLHF